MRYLLLILCIYLASLDISFASSKICQSNKYIKKIGTDKSLGIVSKLWFITVSDARSSENSNSDIKISINKDRASINDERGRALYVLATNAINNGYQVRLVDNFGTNCQSVDEIDVFRMP